MEEIKLDVQIRNEIGTQKAKELRRNNFIPAIVYGGKRKSTPIKVDRGVFDRIQRQHKGESVVLHLNVMEGDKKLRDYSTIIKEIHNDPVTDKALHVDFHRISLTEVIEVKVSIVTKGESASAKKDGGSVDQRIWELDIACLPTDIPQNIEVDVSNLNINESIHVKDLVLPASVKTKHDPEDIVVSIAPPMKEEEPKEAEEEAGAEEPEVIKEKKGEPEEAAGEEPAKEKPKEGQPKQPKAEGK